MQTPPFTRESATIKVRLAENAWNTREPERVALAYSEDSRWRNRAEFFSGRAAITAFLQRKWDKERDYRLIKELWAFDQHRIAMRFVYEWHDDSNSWFRAHGAKRFIDRKPERDHWQSSGLRKRMLQRLSIRRWLIRRCAEAAK